MDYGYDNADYNYSDDLEYDLEDGTYEEDDEDSADDDSLLALPELDENPYSKVSDSIPIMVDPEPPVENDDEYGDRYGGDDAGLGSATGVGGSGIWPDFSEVGSDGDEDADGDGYGDRAGGSDPGFDLGAEAPGKPFYQQGLGSIGLTEKDLILKLV